MTAGRRWVPTLSALSGLVFAALIVLAPEPAGPGEHASAETIALFYEANGQAIRTALVITAVGYMFFVWFSALLTTHLRGRDGSGASVTRIAIAAAVLITAFQVAGTALWAAPSLVDVSGRDPAEVGSLAAFGSLSQEALVVTASFWRALLLGAVGIAVVRIGMLNRWFGWLTLLLAAVSLIAPIGLGATEKNELISALGFTSHLAFYAWVAVASVVLAVTLRPTEQAQTRT